MAAVYLYAFVDRHILILLVEPMRVDLGLSDTQFSLAQSFGFAVALGLASVPAGRLVDRGSRAVILAVAVAFWSVMTALTALATGLAMLLACRIGVAIGQAALNPATYALIADRFPPERMGLALGIFGMAPHFGAGVASLAGAAVLALMPTDGADLPLLGRMKSWQIALILVGLPGPALAALVLWTSNVPMPGGAVGAEPLQLSTVLAYFRRNLRSFMLVKLATGFAAIAVHATAAWTVSLLMRSHDWSLPAAGAALGPVLLSTGAIGALCGGAVGDWLHRRRGDGRIVVMMLATLAAIPFAAFGPMHPNPFVLLAFLGMVVLCASMAVGLNPAATMAIMPPAVRGVATALGVLLVNMIGLGCGPLLVAIVSDRAVDLANPLGFALAAVVTLSLVASTLCLACCRRSYALSLAQLQDAEDYGTFNDPKVR